MTTLPVVEKTLGSLKPLDAPATKIDKRLRRRRLIMRTGYMLVFAIVLVYLIYQSRTRAGIYTDLLSGYYSFIIGAVVGAGELMDRYRDNPLGSLAGIPGLVYWAVNGAAAAAAFFLINMFGWTFGLASKTTVNPEAIQVLVAGFGAMALFRSSLFTARIGEQDVRVGPHIILDTVLKVADSAVDRNSAENRAENVKEIMQPIHADKARDILPLLAYRLLQHSLTEDEYKAMNVKINEIFARDDTRSTNTEGGSNPSANSKSYLLGLTLMNYMGKKVLAAAVHTLGSEITKPPTLYLKDITQEADASDGEEVSVDYTVSAIDSEDKPIPINCEPPSGSRFRVGKTTEVNCTATDDKTGLETKGSFNVTVTRKST